MDPMQVEQIAQGQLDGGERLLWSGTPDAGATALAALPVSLFGIPFGAFATFWIWTAFTTTSRLSRGRGPWILFPLFGVPFLLVGLGMLTAPLWVWRAAKRTVYAVTSKRVLIITAGANRGVRSYGPADLGNLVRVERADGRGSLSFGGGFAAGGAWPTNGMVVRVGPTGTLSRVTLVGIPDVREVEHLIRENLLPRAA